MLAIPSLVERLKVSPIAFTPSVMLDPDPSFFKFSNNVGPNCLAISDQGVDDVEVDRPCEDCPPIPKLITISLSVRGILVQGSRRYECCSNVLCTKHPLGSL